MKKMTKRLVLDRETLRHLRRAELVPAAGGNTGSCLRSCDYSCISNEGSGCRPCFPQ